MNIPNNEYAKVEIQTGGQWRESLPRNLGMLGSMARFIVSKRFTPHPSVQCVPIGAEKENLSCLQALTCGSLLHIAVMHIHDSRSRLQRRPHNAF